MSSCWAVKDVNSSFLMIICCDLLRPRHDAWWALLLLSVSCCCINVCQVNAELLVCKVFRCCGVARTGNVAHRILLFRSRGCFLALCYLLADVSSSCWATCTSLKCLMIINYDSSLLFVASKWCILSSHWFFPLHLTLGNCYFFLMVGFFFHVELHLSEVSDDYWLYCRAWPSRHVDCIADLEPQDIMIVLPSPTLKIWWLYCCIADLEPQDMLIVSPRLTLKTCWLYRPARPSRYDDYIAEPDHQDMIIVSPSPTLKACWLCYFFLMFCFSFDVTC
jgi:hypothetical protein